MYLKHLYYIIKRKVVLSYINIIMKPTKKKCVAVFLHQIKVFALALANISCSLETLKVKPNKKENFAIFWISNATNALIFVYIYFCKCTRGKIGKILRISKLSGPVNFQVNESEFVS